MQDLETLFGSSGKAKYLQLVGGNYRSLVFALEALNTDGTVLHDLTDDLISWDIKHTDESGTAAQATFQIANPGYQYDPYTGSPVADVLKRNTILRFRKGLRDPATGQVFLLPAFWGYVAQRQPAYSARGNVLSVFCADALKNTIKPKITSPAYENMQANVIATDFLERFASVPPARVKLAPLNQMYPFFQPSDMTVADSLKQLFDPALYWIRADEAGNITTGPRLGSPTLGGGLLGYPDQATAPSELLVAHTLNPLLIEGVNEEEQDFDGVSNQVRVLGESNVSVQILGPVQYLNGKDPSAVAPKDISKQRYPFAQQPAGTSALVAKNVFIEFFYSTNHHLSDSPRLVVLSLMRWRGAYTAAVEYKVDDAVSFTDGFSYACVAPSSPSDPHGPGNTDYWAKLQTDSGEPINGPFTTETKLYNETGDLIGYLKLESVTASDLILTIEGRQYSKGGGLEAVRHYGGFDFQFNVYGQPLLVNDKAITAFADYNKQIVSGEVLQDIFSDHVTFQAAHAPLAMSQPIEVFLDGESLGKIAADATVLSGEQNFGVDYERGRIVLKKRTYAEWTGDAGLVTGGTNLSGYGGAIDLVLPENVAPEAVYRTARQASGKNAITYTFTGLSVGQSYDIYLHFFDPASTLKEQRIFSVYCQGAKMIEGLDIVAKSGGKYRAWQETLSGVAPDLDGKVTILFTQKDPVSGSYLDEAKGDPAIISGIEFALPQGQGASPYTVNCGGPDLPVTVPVVTASYGYSPEQAEYGIQSLTIDDALLASQDECQQVAGFWVNYSQWRCHRQTVPCASIPHLQPGDLIRYTHPNTGVVFYAYIEGIQRTGGANAPDRDTYSVFIIYAG